MEAMGKANAGLPMRQTASGEILEQVEKLVALSAQLAARTEDRLHSVLRQGPPPGGELKKVEVARSYPPLFDALRGKFDLIEQNLKAIGETLERVES